MSKLLKAVRYRNLDEARTVLKDVLGREPQPDPFDDDGEEPEGLLSVIPEDRLGEEDFVRLFGIEKGILVEVEKAEWSGFGPPALEEDYMGFVSENAAYILPGARLPIEISGCPLGARDIHHLDFMILDGTHPIGREDLARRLDLPEGWDFELLLDRIAGGSLTADEIDQAVHLGIQ